MEEHSACYAAWLQAAVDTHSITFLHTSAVEVQELEEWSEVPDVVEGGDSEIVTPLGGDTDAIEQSG